MSWVERYVSVAGGGAHDGTSEANAWTMAEAIAAPYAAGQRVNVKAGTYTAAARTFGVSGAGTDAIWWRGYNTTIGDIDTDNTLTKPLLEAGTNVQTISGSYQIFSNFTISGNVTGNLLSVTGDYIRLHHCVCENTNSGSGSYCLRATAAATGICLSLSSFKAHSSASRVILMEERQVVIACRIRGGIIGAEISTSQGWFFNTFEDQAGDAIDCNGTASTNIYFIGNHIYSCTGDAIDVASNLASGLIAFNIIYSAGGYGINNSSAGVIGGVWRWANAFGAVTSGQENQFGDHPNFGPITLSGDPWVDAASGDFNIDATASEGQLLRDAILTLPG